MSRVQDVFPQSAHVFNKIKERRILITNSFETEYNPMDPNPPISLFDVVANNDFEGMLYLYALSSKKALLSASRLNGFPHINRTTFVSGKI
jgi:hypothetical protein